MLVECFLAVREQAGSYLWGGLILVDGVEKFAAARVFGRGPQCSTLAAEYEGARQLLRRLQAIRRRAPWAKFLLLSDSQRLIRQMRGDLRSEQTEVARLVQQELRAFDRAQKDVGTVNRMLILRYVPTSKNVKAHCLISEICRKYGIG